MPNPASSEAADLLQRDDPPQADGAHRPRLAPGELAALRDRLARIPGVMRGYARWKVRLDPVYALALPHLLGADEVVDLGSGLCLLAALLLHRSPGSRVRAIEWDAAKVAAARRLVADLPGVQVEQGDARTVELRPCDAIVLFDVLHYSDLPAQRAWLARAAAALRPGGKILIRELDGKGTLATALERVAVTLGMNRGDAVHPRPAREIAGDLQALGLDVEILPAGRALFRANALLIGRKPRDVG